MAHNAVIYPSGYWNPDQEHAIAARSRREAQASEVDELIENLPNLNAEQLQECTGELRVILMAHLGLGSDSFVLDENAFHNAARIYLRCLCGGELRRLLAAVKVRSAELAQAKWIAASVIRTIWNLPVPRGADDVDGDGADTYPQ